MATSSSALMAPLPVKLDPVRRLVLARRLIDLATAGLLLHHEHAAWLATLSERDFWSSESDRRLLAGITLLTAFVRDRAEDGIALPTWHRCYVAPAVHDEDDA